MSLIIHTDGGSRSNPGNAAIGVVVFHNNECIYEQATYIGIATNNEAEYRGLLAALEWLQQNVSEFPSGIPVICKLDSKLVVEQLNKNWKIKEPRMAELAQKCWNIMATLPFKITLTHVRRAENAAADALVNQAL